MERSNVSHPPRQPRDDAAEKQFLAAHARAQALIPSTADVTGVQAPFRPNSKMSFDEFSFTVVLIVPCGAEAFHTTVFEYMRLTGKQDEMDDLNGFSPRSRSCQRTEARPNQPFGCELWPLRKQDNDRASRQFFATSIYPLCTRKADGAAIKVAFWTPLHQIIGQSTRGEWAGILYFDDYDYSYSTGVMSN